MRVSVCMRVCVRVCVCVHVRVHFVVVWMCALLCKCVYVCACVACVYACVCVCVCVREREREREKSPKSQEHQMSGQHMCTPTNMNRCYTRQPQDSPKVRMKRERTRLIEALANHNSAMSTIDGSYFDLIGPRVRPIDVS